MRKRMIIVLAVVLLIVSVISVALANEPADHYSTVVHDISDLPNVTPIEGSQANLVVNDQGATLRVQTSGLTPGHALTVWWVIFNNPENCTDGGDGVCGFGDAFPPPGNEAAGASVSYAAGNVIGGSGKGQFGAHISAGGDAAPWKFGLVNPRTAEYHFILRDHGPAIPGIVNEQINTAGGGCNNIPPKTGDYTCVDIQAGMFGE